MSFRTDLRIFRAIIAKEFGWRILISLVEIRRRQAGFDAEECVRIPQARASSGSNHAPEAAADFSDRETLVGYRKNGLGCCRRVNPHFKLRSTAAVVNDVYVIRGTEEKESDSDA